MNDVILDVGNLKAVYLLEQKMQNIFALLTDLHEALETPSQPRKFDYCSFTKSLRPFYMRPLNNQSDKRAGFSCMFVWRSLTDLTR